MKKIGFILFLVVGAVNLEAKFMHPKYVQELIGGYSFGAIGYCIGVNGANAIWGNEGNTHIIGGYLLYGLGASLGLWITGKQYDDGKYVNTLIGTILFPLALAGITKAMAIESKEVNEMISFSLPIGAFIGYNFSKNKDKE